MSKLDQTLTERADRYGRFEDNARMSNHIKGYMRESPGWDNLTVVQKEALDQIACKISRIFSGDPNYIDNWHDIAGYAQLAQDDIRERANPQLPVL